MFTSFFQFAFRVTILSSLLGALATCSAQSPLLIYTDHLVNGFDDWSWPGGGDNVLNTTPVHSGSDSWRHPGGAWNAISIHHNDFNATLYTNFSFWANGGSGGQLLLVSAQIGTNNTAAATPVQLTLTATWQQFNLSLASLGISNATNVTRLNLQLDGGGATGPFYLDDVQLGPKTLPALMHVSVNAEDTIRAADARWFGVNTATWDGLLGNANTIPSLQEMGCLALRWPGGSTSDGYHWASDIAGNGRFMHVATNIGAQVFITINYGSGTTNEAAGWVKFMNVTNHCGFKYWEIGNENYGTWETDTNNPPNDPWTYANLTRSYIAEMKAADPSIKVGVVVVPGEDSSVNNMNHAVVNTRTGATHYGWTPVLLNTLKSIGVTPDFVIYHFYAQYTPSTWAPNVTESDPLLLQVAVNWASDAADLRQQLTDYLGASATNVELVCTENNCDAGSMGRQSTSIVNALYLADSASQLMKTEFNSYLWWDLHNSTDTSGVFDSSLYGWRNNGDYGVLSQSNAKYPTFYAEKLLQYFVRPGDTVLKASSDSLWLSAYSSRKTNGSLALLVINKTASNSLSAELTFTNFLPGASAVVRSFGIAQDEAARTNGPAASKDIATNTITASAIMTNSFPAYSLTLLTVSPAAPNLSVVQPASPGTFVFRLHGQSGTPYVIQSSGDLNAWTAVSTNTLAGNSLDVTNSAAAPGPKFWRALWQP